MKKSFAVLTASLFLLSFSVPLVSAAAPLNYQQASSIVMLLQAFGVPANTVATVWGILQPNSSSTGTTSQNRPSKFQDPLLSIPTTVVIPQPQNNNLESIQSPMATTPIVPIVQQPVMPPAAPQGVTEQVGYDLSALQREIPDMQAEATQLCTNGKTDPRCVYFYGQIADYQSLANLIQSEWSTNRNQDCDDKLDAVYLQIRGTIDSYFVRSMNLAISGHTASYAQGMEAQYLSEYQSIMSGLPSQAQAIAGTCFGLPQ